MIDSRIEKENDSLINYKEIIIIPIIFIGIITIIILLFRYIFSFLNIPESQFWPIHMSFNEPNLVNFLITASIFCIFLILSYMAIKKNFNFRKKLTFISLIGLLLIVLTNLIYGFQQGLIYPVVGRYNSEIYVDALNIENPITFLSDFENINFITIHSKTHPPGAFLLFYFLNLIFFYPALISIVICIISTLFSSFFFFKIIEKRLENDIPAYITFLFLILPSIQIFYLMNLYSIVNTLFLGILYFYHHVNKIKSLVGTTICLFLVSFLTYMVVFIIFVLIIYEGMRSRKIKNFKNQLISYLSVFLIYLTFYYIFNFNYISTFLKASRFENPGGFLLFYDPFNYIYTRIEDILEIIIFFGPYLSFLFYKGWYHLKKTNPELKMMTYSALISLLAIFLAGAYRFGETARGCIYIYPYLLFPIASYLNFLKPSNSEKFKLLILVFGQSLLMQLVGYYWW